jgi:sugar O-acyltransferase (sialic acid O-acetyltransferase NeuD family)
MSKQPIILVGGGGHCISCIDVIEQTGLYEIIGVLDLPEKKGTELLGYPVIGMDDDIPTLITKCPNFHITVGQIKSSRIRQSIFAQIKQAGGQLPVIISPKAHVSKHATIAEGTIIMHQALVNAGASIGKACIVNSKALIEHEATVGDFCHISTAACINGQATIGASCFIGSNTVVGNNITIVDNTIVAVGSQVLKSIDKSGVYIGNPLRKIK